MKYFIFTIFYSGTPALCLKGRDKYINLIFAPIESV